jgi:hypothetical protein
MMVGRAKGDGPFERTAGPGGLYGSGPCFDPPQRSAAWAQLEHEVHMDFDILMHLQHPKHLA